MASGDRTYIADKATLDEVNANIGTSSATASSSGTSLFALLKYVVTSVGNLLTYIGTSSATASASGTSLFALLKYVTGWATSARGTKIDNIGAAGDTGGTASAGTVMGKENKIITDVGTVNTNIGTSSATASSSGTSLFALLKYVVTSVGNLLTYIGTSSATASASGTSVFALIKYLTGWATSARGTKIDNIGATGDTSGTASAGTVMGKLNRLIGDNDADLVYMKEALAITGSITTASFSNSTSAATYKRIGNFAVSKAGKVTVLVNVNSSANTDADTYVFISTTSTASPSASTAAGAVATSKVSTVPTSQRYFVCDLEATARTYYVYICVAASTTAKTTTINDIHASVTYTSSLRTPERGAVKSVQRQNLYRLGQTEYDGYISIDNVVPENCAVFAVMGSSTNPVYLGYTVMADRLYLYNMTGEVGASLNNTTYFSGCLQIVEYY